MLPLLPLGPRNCIGNRLGLLKVKTGVAHIVHNFKILATPRTPQRLELDPKRTSVEIKGGSWVKFERRGGMHGRRLSRQGSALLK